MTFFILDTSDKKQYNRKAVCHSKSLFGGFTMDKIKVGMTIKLIKDLVGKMPIGSTATVVYIDDFDQIFVDWTDGGQAILTEEQLLSNFVAA